jgi:protein phosphatase
MEIASVSDVGGREANEDKVLTVNFGDINLLVVADGMGGHAAGEVASNIAVTEIQNFLESRIGGGDIIELINRSITQANREVYRQSQENEAYAGMGTTVVMAVVIYNLASIANIGDSRAYRISGNRITQLTKDHSAVQDLMDRGVISREEAREHPSRHVITRVIGTEPEVRPDLFTVPLRSGDILLLCSDGLTDVLLDEEIYNVIQSSGDLNAACNELVKHAMANHAHDNISVVLGRKIRE